MRNTGKCHCGLYGGGMSEEETIDFIVGLILNDTNCTCFPNKNENTICRNLELHKLYSKALEKIKERF